MKNAKKLILVLAIAVFAFICMACGKETTKTETTPTPTATQPAAVTTTEATPTPTREVRDLKGMEFKIVDWWTVEGWNTPNSAYETAYWEFIEEECKKDNFTISRFNAGGWGTEYTEARMLEITNNAPCGQVITFDNTWIASLLSQGAFLDVSKLKSINWSDKKFNQAAIQAMTFGDAIYGFAAGLEPRTGVFFNLDIFKNLGVDTDLPYKLQREGNWTYDEFKKLAKQLTKDTDGDGKTDIYGVTGQNTIFFQACLMGNGTFVVTKGDDGKLIMNAKDQKVLDSLNYGRSFYDEGIFYEQPVTDGTGAWDYFKTGVYEGKVAMFVEEQYAISNLNQEGVNAGFVNWPQGPYAEAPLAFCRENILIIPSCPSTADIAEDIAFAYNLYTDVPAEWVGDDAVWSSHYETLFNDEKAVTETINNILNVYTPFMNASMYLDEFAPQWLYDLDNKTGSEVLETYSSVWQASVDKFNAAN